MGFQFARDRLLGQDMAYDLPMTSLHSSNLHFATVDEAVEARVDLVGQDQLSRSIPTPHQASACLDKLGVR